jgi:phosphoribosylamine--glycine ligase
MNIAIIGKGAREHALAWRLKQDNSCQSVVCIPGNDGIRSLSTIPCVEWDYSNFEKLADILEIRSIDLVIVGPEKFLHEGLCDFLIKENILCLGPMQNEAKFETSKSFSKRFMEKYNIPTAKFVECNDYFEALDCLDNWKGSVPVVKADGLASGKGVFVNESFSMAKESIYNLFRNKSFPISTDKVVIEEKLSGYEISSFALFNGQDYINLGHCTDYKRLLDNDKGPNTGGMGTFCDANWPSVSIKQKINKLVFDRFKEGIRDSGLTFHGILFAGLMIDGEDVHVIEFNVRLGDPETQSLLLCLKGDLSNTLYNAANGSDFNDELSLEGSSVHVVLAGEQYADLNDQSPEKLVEIPLMSKIDDSQVFYAGVKAIANKLYAGKGRVLGISAKGDSIEAARGLVYKNINSLSFDGAKWRSDIGITN